MATPNSLAKKQSNSSAFRVAWEECLLIIEFMEQQKHHQYKTKEQKKKKKNPNTRKALKIHGDTRTMNKKESIESSKENSESFSASDGDLPLPINSRSKYISPIISIAIVQNQQKQSRDSGFIGINDDLLTGDDPIQKSSANTKMNALALTETGKVSTSRTEMKLRKCSVVLDRIDVHSLNFNIRISTKAAKLETKSKSGWTQTAVTTVRQTRSRAKNCQAAVTPQSE